MTTLEQIRDLEAGAAYPGHLLEGRKDALVLFAAGFLGKQDAYWIADAGLRATCVDEDDAKLDAMMLMYPDGWEYVAGDVYAYAETVQRQWDIVSLDPWTQDFQKCADHAQLWCDLARHGVVLGSGVNTTVEAPGGWIVTETRRRSDYDGGVFWTVLEPV